MDMKLFSLNPLDITVILIFRPDSDHIYNQILQLPNHPITDGHIKRLIKRLIDIAIFVCASVCPIAEYLDETLRRARR